MSTKWVWKGFFVIGKVAVIFISLVALLIAQTAVDDVRVNAETSPTDKVPHSSATNYFIEWHLVDPYQPNSFGEVYVEAESVHTQQLEKGNNQAQFLAEGETADMQISRWTQITLGKDAKIASSLPLPPGQWQRTEAGVRYWQGFMLYPIRVQAIAKEK